VAENPGPPSFGQRVGQLRTHRGLSQKQLAAEIGRSESWVSQVERDVLPVERIPVLRSLADALQVSLADLQPRVQSATTTENPDNLGGLEDLRLTLTGHPTPLLLLQQVDAPPHLTLAEARAQVADAWELTHRSQFAQINDALATLIPQLEHLSRSSTRPTQRREFSDLLASAYQAASAAFAKIGEPDASWVAADRSIAVGERGTDPLAGLAGHFRMAHAFIRLIRLEQAEIACRTGIEALSRTALEDNTPPNIVSLYGALHLALAVTLARAGRRVEAREALDDARETANRLGHDRDDYGTEFGPTNVGLHAVAVAVDLGDFGEALALAELVNAKGLSPERQASHHIDKARAHAALRHSGDAIGELLAAEHLAAELVRNNNLARQTARELSAILGRTAPEELRDLIQRWAAT
jgi:transcriptional regulator with XRE-family HTH domain